MCCSNCNCSCGCNCTHTAHCTCSCKTATICPSDVVTVHQGDVTVNTTNGPVLKAERSFSIPLADGITQGKISVYGEVANVPVGGLLYVADQGQVAYLRVISTQRFFVESTNLCQSECETSCVDGQQAYRTEFTVVNDGLDCTTLPPGSTLDQGTTLLLDAPGCASTVSGGTSDLVLCDNLHVPEVGATETVVVSPDSSSLFVGDIVQITDKRFQVESVPTADTVELKNTGEGGDPGTVIDGTDCSSVRIFRIAGANPCAKDPVAEGDAVRVCAAGDDTILALNDDEYVAKVNGKIVGVPIQGGVPTQTDFEGCVTLNPAASPQEYPLTVTTPGNFEVGDAVIFSCDEESRVFKVVGKAGSVLTLEPQFSVTVVESIGCEDCKLVHAGCCEQLSLDINEELDNTIRDPAWFPLSLGNISITAGNIVENLNPADLDTENDIRNVTLDLVVANPSTVRNFGIMTLAQGTVKGGISGTSKDIRLKTKLEVTDNLGGIISQEETSKYLGGGDADAGPDLRDIDNNSRGFSQNTHLMTVVPAGDSVTISGEMSIQHLSVSTPGDSVYNFDSTEGVFLEMRCLGVID